MTIMPRVLPALALLFAALAFACGGDDDADSRNWATDRRGIATGTATTESSDQKPALGPTPEPGEISVANEPFSVETADGVVLKGNLYSPDGPKRQALIIAAPVGQSLWAESTEAFTREGVAVFTFDPRGIGESGGEEDASAMAADLQLVTLFVKSREYPLIYVMAVGTAAAEAALEGAAQRDDLAGLVTYGFEGEGIAVNQVAMAPGVTWDSQNVFEQPAVTEQVLNVVLGN